MVEVGRAVYYWVLAGVQQCFLIRLKMRAIRPALVVQASRSGHVAE